MIPLKEMQKVGIFKPLSNKMMEELAAIGDITTADEGVYLFHDGEPAENFYIIKEGKVILDFEQPDGSVDTETVGPGMGVGCSSLAGLPRYNAHGRCAEPSRFLQWRQSKLQRLFDENHRLGYLLIRASAKRLSRRISGKLHK
ncbi:MAG: Crp/Fnr family transcriptional regulator [Deltaproteobacteria bacterium]|nr:Crp/Fnr family transcriptional regulator [Deltaproteobacteria bacterium]MBW2050315.1 Crp/Fnr family transcriptional regulator [Deltaproteobacteria bacterium]MBW2112969.1 Crp/Fnr family transcriptional regulator [Deltaproteobacteria bacterium]MBW2352328.1 Crp/Fnr family transcriptional regulator [Deltaproteobacteria bacterium]